MEFDAVVIGSGVSGSVAAFYLAESGLKVAVINKETDLKESNTYYAQGGISYQGPGDSPEKRYDDIMQAGAGVCLPDAVKVVAEQGPAMIDEVLVRDFHVAFTKTTDAQFHLTEEGAHTIRRILHSEDVTGRTIEKACVSMIKEQKNIKMLAGYTVVDIITWDHHAQDDLRMYRPPTALGVYALDNATGQVHTILAKTVILASGGMGQVYLHTTNPQSATGDGYAMASRAGARLINMEYTQFHPTTLYHPQGNSFLVSEAVRGEGAVIVDRKGNAFMEKYHEQKDLAPRDIVTRSILSELLESGDKHVFLDATRIGKAKITGHFPNIYKTLFELGIDMTSEPIPIVPAFHFSCGGIATNLVGRTSVKRLFAVGEAACTGLHGANRLASTSLLEGLVFGKRIADYISSNWDKFLGLDYPPIPDWVYTGTEQPDPALLKQDWGHLQTTMWYYVGAVRSQKRLQRAMVDLKNLNEEVESFYRDARITRGIVELRNAIQTGLIIADHAWAQKKSLGTHYRID